MHFIGFILIIKINRHYSKRGFKLIVLVIYPNPTEHDSFLKKWSQISVPGSNCTLNLCQSDRFFIHLLPQVAASAGYNVTLVDLNEDVLKVAEASINKNLNRVAKRQFKDNETEQSLFVKSALQRLNTSVDVGRTVENTDLVIEAIVEVMSVKHKLFSAIDKVCSWFVLG